MDSVLDQNNQSHSSDNNTQTRCRLAQNTHTLFSDTKTFQKCHLIFPVLESSCPGSTQDRFCAEY